MALDYLRQNPATSSFVVGMRQGQTNNFIFPSSERKGDGEINLGEIPGKKRRFEQNTSPDIMVEIVTATHSLRNRTELTPAETTGVFCASYKPPSGTSCPHTFDPCSDTAAALG